MLLLVLFKIRLRRLYPPPSWNTSYFHLLLVIILLNFFHPASPQIKYSTRIIETAYGKVRGIIIPKSGSMPRDVEGYLGIKYASAPAASLRFMPPLTPSHWSDIKLADKFGPVCPQLLPDIQNRSRALSKMPLLKYTRLLNTAHLLSNQSEDCLFLNIYMPKPDEYRMPNSQGPGLAIVVVLHGDSWEWGSGSLIDGSALSSLGNVIVITLNYRLGILGFLQTSSQQGNFAIMDIVAALNWIRENAGAFGGDSTRVTLMGFRTGAVLANFLMLAPVASELFHRVILLSGSSLSPWSFQRHSKGNVRKIAQYFKCINEGSILSSSSMSTGPSYPPNKPISVVSSGAPSTSSTSDLGPCLRDIPLEELLKVIESELVHPRFIARLGPLIDSTVVKSDFVSEMKYDSNGHFSRFQLLVGSSSIESFDELNTEDIEDGLQDIKRDRILRTLVRNVFVFHLNEIYSTIKNEYTDWEKPKKDFIDVRDSILNILSDALTLAPMIQVANFHSHKARAKTYFCHFQYEPDYSVYPHRMGSISEDLMDFSLGHPIMNTGNREPNFPSYSTSDIKISSSFVKYISNFIVSGDPNSGYDTTTSSSSISSAEENQAPFWDPYDPINQLYLEIEPNWNTYHQQSPLRHTYKPGFVYGGWDGILHLDFLRIEAEEGSLDLVMVGFLFFKLNISNSQYFYNSHTTALVPLYMTKTRHKLGGGEPRMRSHYRGHKMALWLNLIPQLHQSGGTDVSMLHHNFREEKPDYYEGNVREQSKHPPTPGPPLYPSAFNIRPNRTRIGTHQHQQPHQNVPSVLSSDEEPPGDYYNTVESDPKLPIMNPTISPATILSSSECPPNSTMNSSTATSSGGSGLPNPGNPDSSTDRDLVRQLAASHYHSYGTALGVTIGVGCCLLLLNLLIFLAIYHQKTQNNQPPQLQTGTGGSGKSRTTVSTTGGGGIEDQNQIIDQDAVIMGISDSLCHQHHYSYGTSGGFPYGDNGITSGGEEFEEEILQAELHHQHPQHLHRCGGPSGSCRNLSSSSNPGAYLHKEISSSSGFSSPPIPAPPPPPRSSIPPSLAGSMISLASSLSVSAGGSGAAGILRRPPPPERTDSTTSGSMKKRVQIQEISV